jgi:hypothetical protein
MRANSGREDRRLDTGEREALRVVAGAPAATEVDWWTLRRTIVEDAAAFLGEARRRPWWDYAAGWIRPAVPVGMAVSIMAMVVLGSAGTITGTITGTALSAVADTTDASVWLHAVRGGGAASDVDPLLGESRIATALVDDASASTK